MDNKFRLTQKIFEVEVAEMLRVDYNPVVAGKPEPLFWSEVTPITRKTLHELSV